MLGAKGDIEDSNEASKPRVKHGATIEGIIGRTTVRTRQCRLAAGLPVGLWPLIMAGYLFAMGWFAAEAFSPALREKIQGEWVPIPIGARVLYLATSAKDTIMKQDRFGGPTAGARFGLMAGYGVDFTPPRSYYVIDESDLFTKSKLRVVTSE